MNVSLGWIDVTVLVLALLGAIAIGLWSSRKNRSTDAFLYADRSMPWWAILGSIGRRDVFYAFVFFGQTRQRLRSP